MDNPPRMSPGLKKLIRKSERLYKRQKNSGSTKDDQCFKDIKRGVQK